MTKGIKFASEQENEIVLLQPRHIYAPSRSLCKYGHIYMPTSLITAASILIKLGMKVKIVDKNIEDIQFSNRNIGMNLIGAPYIPIGIQIKNMLENRFGKEYTLFLGGQVVSGLTNNQLIRLFGNNTYNGNNFNEFKNHFDCNRYSSEIKTNISLTTAYDLISNEQMKCYLSNEFGFYLSEGCKFSCQFCAAKRSIVRSETTLKGKRQKEEYRNLARRF